MPDERRIAPSCALTAEGNRAHVASLQAVLIDDGRPVVGRVCQAGCCGQEQ